MKNIFFLLVVVLSVCNPSESYAYTAPSDSGSETCKSKQVTMQWSYEAKDNEIKISFPEKEIRQKDPEQWQYFSTHTTYPFEEAFPLPDDLWKSLGSAKPLIIKAGYYAVTFHDGYYEITIPL